MALLAHQPREVRAAGLARVSPPAVGSGNAVLARWVNDDYAAAKALVAYTAIGIDLRTATDREKLVEIRRLNAAGEWKAASYVWESFGLALGDFALANRALFEATLEHEPTLIEHPGFGELSADFKNAAEKRIRENLANNKYFVHEEMKRLGIAEALLDEPGENEEKELRELQIMAEAVSKAQDGMQRMRMIPVGIEPHPDLPGVDIDTLFRPEKDTSTRKGEGPQYREWADVKKEYDKLDMAVRLALAKSPALFAIIGDRNPRQPWAYTGEKAAGLARQSPAEARAALRPLLLDLLARIEDADKKVGGELDYRDATPVHAQLMETPAWSGALERALVAHIVKEHSTSGLLRTLGLAVLSAAGFVVAAFATGGMAVFIGVAVGVGASTTQAGLSIKDYLDKSAAREAHTGDPELDIMSQEAVDAAFLSAVIDTAFAILDLGAGAGELLKLGSPSWKLAKAAEAGTRASAEASLKEAIGLPAGALGREQAIERGVAELGTEGASKASGLAPGELATLLPAESEAARKLLAAADAATAGVKQAGDLAAELKRLPLLAPPEAERVVGEAFERHGYLGTLEMAGGWKTLTKRFGEGHRYVTELERWRAEIVNEAAGFLKTSSKGKSSAVRTGTEKGTSDVDISTFGKDAAQSVDRVKEYMARRLGTTRDRLEFLLDADAAVNPSRMHLQDVVKGLSDRAHNEILSESAKHQEKLIFARRWHDAVEGGDTYLQRQLEELASSAGIGDIPKTWKPMTPQEIAGLERSMDEWAAKLAKLEQAGADEAAKRPLIEKIGRAQAEVLANNPNMYLDAGNIKTLVTRRPIDLKKVEAALGAMDADSLIRLGKVFSQERYLKVLGEGPHINHAFRTIRSSTNAQEIANAYKAFVKHGDRVLETIGDVAHGLEPRAFDYLAGSFERTLELAKTPKFVDQAAQNMYELKARTELQAAKLQSAMATATKALREQASLGKALTADQAAGLAAWARAEGAARAATEALIADLEKLHKGLLSGKIITASGQLADPDPMDPMYGE
jgi:hypothetical protein